MVGPTTAQQASEGSASGGGGTSNEPANNPSVSARFLQ